jgi:hypothetical protein
MTQVAMERTTYPLVYLSTDTAKLSWSLGSKLVVDLYTFKRLDIDSLGTWRAAGLL